MFTPILRIPIVSLTILALVSLTPFLADAQERTNSDGTAVEAEANTSLEANYNNSRSNRSTISTDNDTNVCDGATCPDGSCAATPDECTATAVDPDYTDSDADGDGIDDAVEGANYNNSRSNRANISSPVDVAATTSGETRIREGGQTIDAGTVPERAQNHNSSRSNETEGAAASEDLDSDDDGIDDGTTRAQDYNSSRSNKPSRSIFADTDADGRPEVSLRGGAFVNVSNDPPTASARANDAADGDVYCWGRGEDSDGQIYAWGSGICIAGEAAASASDTSQARLAALQVRGDDVRAWSEEQQAAWREFRQTRATSSSEERLIERIVEKTQANARIREISADDQEVGMEYETTMRLFGIIPLQRTINARANAGGEVTIDYPWYRFLSRVPEQSTIRNTLSELHVLHADGGLDKATPLLMQ